MQIDYFKDLKINVQQALDEDLASGDLTAQLIPEQAQATAQIICRENAVICGRPWFDAVFLKLDSQIQIQWHCNEGSLAQPNQLICTLSGNARQLLSAERSALNFLQTLSGTATTTHQYVSALQKANSQTGGRTQLLDTRKTLPGLRLAQKYAVHCAGAQNHRIGLYDAILIKENHIMAAGGIDLAVKTAQQLHPGKTIEVECELLDEVEQALNAGADIIMLDNFSHAMMSAAVILVDGRAKLEVSGNVTLADLPELAKTKVDYISTGAITKHLQATDFSMRFTLQPIQ